MNEINEIDEKKKSKRKEIKLRRIYAGHFIHGTCFCDTDACDAKKRGMVEGIEKKHDTWTPSATIHSVDGQMDVQRSPISNWISFRGFPPAKSSRGHREVFRETICDAELFDGKKRAPTLQTECGLQ